MLGRATPGKVKTGQTAGDYGPIAWTLRTKMALLEYVALPMLRGCFLLERLLRCLNRQIDLNFQERVKVKQSLKREIG